jgi:hypothetical protein
MSDSMDWTAGECCRKTALECDSRDVDSCLIIILEKGKNGNEYNSGFRNSGMSLSECIALLEIQKSRMLAMMNTGVE